ncbi:MAG: hypothetical protein K0R78_687 [Pelosinus sp.]|jgi:vacuolar-type H+-ATPase subunit I/STV1|nr:hypothetical protein [Pelosinus sp.]
MESENDRWDWIDSHLTKYNEILQEMKGRAFIIPADLKLDYLRQVQQLEQQQNTFNAKYRKLQEASGDERDKMQEPLDKFRKELEKSFDHVIKKYSKIF